MLFALLSKSFDGDYMETLLLIIEYIGVISFAASGAMVAIDKEADIFGVILMAIVTSFGGGIVRDTIVSRGLPLFFTNMAMPIIACILTALIVFTFAALFKKKYVEEEALVLRINNVLDALGLGVFAATGAHICIEYGPFTAVVLAMITAVGGGLVRDVILNDIPSILVKRIYAIAVIAGASVYYVIEANSDVESAGVNVVATLACVAVVFAIRMLATFLKLNLPKAIIFSKIKCDDEKNKDI